MKSTLFFKISNYSLSGNSFFFNYYSQNDSLKWSHLTCIFLFHIVIIRFIIWNPACVSFILLFINVTTVYLTLHLYFYFKKLPTFMRWDSYKLYVILQHNVLICVCYVYILTYHHCLIQVTYSIRLFTLMLVHNIDRHMHINNNMYVGKHNMCPVVQGRQRSQNFLLFLYINDILKGIFTTMISLSLYRRSTETSLVGI